MVAQAEKVRIKFGLEKNLGFNTPKYGRFRIQRGISPVLETWHKFLKW